MTSFRLNLSRLDSVIMSTLDAHEHSSALRFKPSHSFDNELIPAICILDNNGQTNHKLCRSTRCRPDRIDRSIQLPLARPNDSVASQIPAFGKKS